MHSMSGLILKEPSHEYFLNGLRIPGATGILKANGVIEDTWFNEGARFRGTAVHACCHYLAEGYLDLGSVKPEIIGFLNAYQEACQSLDFWPQECETAIYHPIYLYGVKPDQIGIYGGLNGGLKKEGIFELKTGQMQPWTALQTALQAMARWPRDYFTKVRFGIELHEDGTFKAEQFTDVKDFDVAMSMISVYQWKNQKMKKETKTNE